MPAVKSRRDRRARRMRPARRLAGYVRTPKGTLILVLTALLAAATLQSGSGVLPGLIAAVAVAVVLDVVIVRRTKGTVPFPDGAILTGMIVGLIVAPTAGWYASPAAAVIAIASKHLVRTRWSNVFNPAAAGLVASSLLFPSEQSWWGSLPKLSIVGILLVAGLGLYVASRVNKLPLVLTFLGASLAVYTVAAFAGNAAMVAEIFRSPDINAALFFATVMLTDPPTSPAKQRHQIWFALIVAAASCFAFLHFGALWYLGGGLLAGNAYESLRRLSYRRSVEAARLRHAG